MEEDYVSEDFEIKVVDSSGTAIRFGHRILQERY